MKKTTLLLGVLLIASCPAVGAEDTHSLPGSKQSLDELFKGKSPIVYVVACEAAERPSMVIIGNMTDHATQKFKVVAPLAGKCPEGTFALNYSVVAPNDRQVAKGERIIWIAANVSGSPYPVMALADTEANRQAVLAAAKAAGLAIAAPDTQPASQPASQAAAGKTEWPLLENGQIRAGELAVDSSGKLATLVCDVFTSTGDTSKPPVHSGGNVVVDLATGKVTEVAKMFADIPEKLTVQDVAPAPGGQKLAIVAFEAGRPGRGSEIKFTCFLGDVKTGKATTLTTAVGKMKALWAGQSLLVSRNTAEGMDSIERFSADGKKLDMPATYGFVFSASRDGKQLAVVARVNDPGKTIKVEEENQAATLVISDAGQTIKQLSLPGQFVPSCVLSPSGKFAAMIVPIMDASGRQGPPRCTIKVMAVDSDKTWEIKPGTRYLLGISDAGTVYAMDEPPSLPAMPMAGGPAGVEIKQYDTKGQAKTIAKGALDACFAGDKLYYIEAGKTPTLKAIPLIVK